MDCITCGYYWADVNEDGEPESLEYCHFDGPDGWAPCEQDEYNEYEEEEDYWTQSMLEAGYDLKTGLPYGVEEENLYDDEDIEFERYEDWIHDETQRELDEEW